MKITQVIEGMLRVEVKRNRTPSNYNGTGKEIDKYV